MNQKSFYIATNEVHGLDELQRGVVHYLNGDHLALEGPVGSGKNQYVYALAEILEREFIDITCSDEMTESVLVGYPVLAANGGTHTGYVNGIITNAMDYDNLSFLDEANQLSHDLQKRQNSALDERRYLMRRDGKKEEGKENFRIIIAYNPGTAPRNRHDLDESFSDRFKHIYVPYPVVDAVARICMIRSGIAEMDDIFVEGIEKRYVWVNDGRPYFAVSKNGDLLSLPGKTPTELPERYIEYYFYTDKIKQQCLSTDDPDKNMMFNLALSFSRFAERVREVSTKSSSGVSPEVKRILENVGALAGIELNTPTPRTVSRALAYADSLYKIGYDPKNIEQAAMECLTEDVLAGVYRHQLIGQKTKYDVLKELAKTTVIGDKQAQEFAIDFERK